MFRLAALSSLRSAFRPSFVQGMTVRRFGDAAGLLAKDEVTERVLSVVKKFEKVDPAKVSATAHFANDLGLDSLDGVEVVMALEDEFALEISDEDAEKIVSVADAIKFIAANPQAK
ncbi:mitochondrial Complex I (CI) NADH:ubiquinone oxidoreductase subunit SDAP/ACPM/NDUFAB1 [Andalucia godoyi]|uniref:Acyl carrier protein n=1 Tax=Andalucia godoyi TaxID=505711 RepID=A0A8K0AIA1_ANDGO|nr:mitochondrial Complex I (CI) NADH:ubiquinone oxidoreductase subunit SDAP/ACPM/NDUFAB1 [Andalucia godoyi]|eukprot:ANDGO_05434.mRNA.1 mitochondrial Complex I (CI) NADH:ubiquinone oxidoreductase subunit SDAP/ACPM/NDUFAB1 (acyl carrier protein)